MEALTVVRSEGITQESLYVAVSVLVQLLNTFIDLFVAPFLGI